jgi:hypothetical protein
VTDGAFERDVLELEARFNASQHQSATTHVAAADEVVRKQKLSAENRQQQIDVFAGSHAAEEHDFALRTDCRVQRPRGAFERLPVTGVGQVDSSVGKRAQRIDGNACISRAKTGIGRNHEYAVGSHGIVRIRRPRKPSGIRQLAAKVQPAHETKEIPEHCTVATLELSCKGESRGRSQHKLCAATGTVCRR